MITRTTPGIWESLGRESRPLVVGCSIYKEARILPLTKNPTLENSQPSSNYFIFPKIFGERKKQFL